ncbi:MAG: response regulator, partial [Chthoniobacterales bacterium]
MLRVLIVDDEPLARQKLRQLLVAHPELSITGEAECVPEALEKIRAENFDVLFLDVRMPGADGFSLLRELENPPAVIFVTAYSNYAVEAFAFSAIDYLVKPVRPTRLAQAVARLEAKPANDPAWKTEDRICFRTPERTV